MLLGYDLSYEVERVIKSWKPQECKTEKDYEKALCKELVEKLKNRRVESQYGAGRQSVDICVEGKIPIEIKNNLKSQANYHRTKGQLDDYIKKWDKVFLILCGETDPNILRSLKEFAREKAGLFGERIKILQK